MYAGMRSAGPGFALLFVLIILFGQTLFLSLFLSMLMSKFDDVKDALNNQELERQQTVGASVIQAREDSKAQKLLEAQKLRKKSLESPCLTEDLSGHGSLVSTSVPVRRTQQEQTDASSSLTHRHLQQLQDQPGAEAELASGIRLAGEPSFEEGSSAIWIHLDPFGQVHLLEDQPNQAILPMDPPLSGSQMPS